MSDFLNITFTPIMALIIGAIMLFAGYKVQKVMIFIAWFLLGYNLSHDICISFLSNETLLLVINIIIGLVFGSIGYSLERLSLFIAVSYLTYQVLSSYFAVNLQQVFADQGDLMVFAILVAGSMIVGGIAVSFMKPIIIIVTSLYGANLIKLNMGAVVSIEAQYILYIAIALFVIGMIVQFKTNKR